MYQTDIIIVGGGVIGSSIAYNLLNDGYSGDITIFEKDASYEYASTPRSAGGIRQLYTTPINVLISRYSLRKYLTFANDMAVGSEKAEIDFKQRGYLLLGNKKNIEFLKKQHLMQKELGVPSEILTKEEMQDIIPELNVEDLEGGLYCKEDGYLDPYSVLQGYVRKTKQLGGKYVYEEVDTILRDDEKIIGVRLKNGDEFFAPIVINCAGAWAPKLSKKMGLPIPVVPLKRMITVFDIAVPLKKKTPLTVDPTGVYFRHEGEAFITGFAEEVKPGIDFHWNRSLFEDKLWPILADRVPNFAQAKVVRGWSGLYDHNTKDQNAIIGQHPELRGYYLACGFSGHGMQQAPAIGKALSEFIRLGRYETLDLSPLSFERFAKNELVMEEGVY
ncbi:FAD-binding oxidoreductase [Caldibacillus thermolactis]|uniref:FAD-binding oxidoreductase n=1 Tax=Pallidibacillus thermolactis TaxID=251051 RepID=A0ABT2WF40_9BACI|nr:FAD-binding oxidoreductase [Pallidibacillus thermolactis]MCU9593429.1 FAD-binding oxidoreductase [Pallidibacillus thermolactis]